MGAGQPWAASAGACVLRAGGGSVCAVDAGSRATPREAPSLWLPRRTFPVAPQAHLLAVGVVPQVPQLLLPLRASTERHGWDRRTGQTNEPTKQKVREAGQAESDSRCGALQRFGLEPGRANHAPQARLGACTQLQPRAGPGPAPCLSARAPGPPPPTRLYAEGDHDAPAVLLDPLVHLGQPLVLLSAVMGEWRAIGRAPHGGMRVVPGCVIGAGLVACERQPHAQLGCTTQTRSRSARTRGPCSDALSDAY